MNFITIITKVKATTMNITLRKAKVIQTEIMTRIQAIAVTHVVSISEFENVEVSLEEAYQKFLVNDKRRDALTAVFYDIRALVGAANATCGIDSMLTTMAYLDRRIQQITPFAMANERTSLTVLRGEQERIKKSDSSYAWRDTQRNISSSLLTDVHIRAWVEELQRLKQQKQSLNDKVLDLNMRTQITLTDNMVALLKSEHIV
jgi:hypothetical protein